MINPHAAMIRMTHPNAGGGADDQFTRDIAARLGLSERQAAPAEVLAYATRLKKLNELVLALSQIHHLNEAYRVVAAYTREIIGAARVSVGVLRECGAWLDLYSVDGIQGTLSAGAAVPAADTMIGAVVARRAPIRVMDLGAVGWRDVQKLRSMGLRAAVCVPLMVHGRIIGTLNTALTDGARYFPIKFSARGTTVTVTARPYLGPDGEPDGGVMAGDDDGGGATEDPSPSVASSDGDATEDESAEGDLLPDRDMCVEGVPPGGLKWGASPNPLPRAVSVVDIVASDTSASSDATSTTIHFSVQDNGIGIPPERQDSLFDSFSQVDVSTTRKYGGSGLGLCISKQLTELMGGRMWVESAPGVGSTFHFTIRVKIGNVLQPVRGPSRFDSTLGYHLPLKILLVDDVKVNRKVARCFLEKLGYRDVTVAEDGLQAVRLAAATPFDLVLMDIHMPVMNGYRATRQIRLGGANRRARIVAMTADAMTHRRVQALRSGMDDFVSKPVRVEELTRALERCRRPPEAWSAKRHVRMPRCRCGRRRPLAAPPRRRAPPGALRGALASSGSIPLGMSPGKMSHTMPSVTHQWPRAAA